MLRRIPVLLALVPPLRPAVRRAVEALFIGWFGPIGISALFYATLAFSDARLAPVWPVTSLVIVASIVAHGVTATPLTAAFGRAG